MKLAFLDTETTSLRHDRRAWEVAIITRNDEGKDTEYSWFVDSDDLDLGNADLVLLQAEPLLRGATIVGAVPNFDTEVLGNRMREHGICPSWHYHLVDVETLAAGALKLPPPWGFDDILATYGLTYDETDRHTALGDTRMVRDLYDAILNPDLIQARAVAGLAEPAETRTGWRDETTGLTSGGLVTD